MNKVRFQSSKQRGPAVNERIKSTSVRVISEKGDMLGVFDTHDAVKLAFDQGLDLVEVSPNANPPVCKIIDYVSTNIKYRKNKQKLKQKLSKLKKLN